MKKYVLGVDGGATKTHYALFDSSGNVINFIRRGPINTEGFKSFDSTQAELEGGIKEVLAPAGIEAGDIAYSILGLAGADLKRHYDELYCRISNIGVKNFKVYNDAFLGIKAGSDKGYGVCSINGTGTCCVAIDSKGNWVQVGGIGYFSGDEAGGSHVGEMVLRSVYDQFFRCGCDTLLTGMVFDQLGITSEHELADAVFDKVNTGVMKASSLCRLAFLAANQGDKAAIDILEYIGRTTARSVAGAIRRVNFTKDEEIDVVMAGSVYAKGENPALINEFKKEVMRLTDGKVRFVLLKAPPVSGAVLWALEEMGVYLQPAIRQKVLYSLRQTTANEN